VYIKSGEVDVHGPYLGRTYLCRADSEQSCVVNLRGFKTFFGELDAVGFDEQKQYANVTTLRFSNATNSTVGVVSQVAKRPTENVCEFYVRSANATAKAAREAGMRASVPVVGNAADWYKIRSVTNGATDKKLSATYNLGAFKVGNPRLALCWNNLHVGNLQVDGPYGFTLSQPQAENLGAG
jgi:hypothetical protein